MKVAFFGSPRFAVASLRALASRYQVVGVVTQPDRPAGRGRRLTAPPAKIAAGELGLPVHQPAKASAADSLEVVRGWQPDLIVVAAYGQILRRPLLELPPHGCINVHASLLPRWRGAAPVEHAVLAGDVETGVTLMRMDEGLDTGPILAQRPMAIRPDHTGGSLTDDLARLGAELLLDSLPDHLAGRLPEQPQDDGLATFAPRLSPADTVLDPAREAADLERRVRALSPSPGARFRWGDRWLIVHHARLAAGQSSPAGSVEVVDGHPAVATAAGKLVLLEVQVPGGRRVPGKAFLAGHPSVLGAVLSAPGRLPL